MVAGPVLLDTDTLSEVSRANPRVMAQAQRYLGAFGRFTISAVTVFERLRGYRQALSAGKPFQRQLQAFEMFVQTCVVLPFDDAAADVAATIWSACSRAQRHQLGDILIAATAVSRQIPLATRNRRDFERFSQASGVNLLLVDWAASTKSSKR